MFKRGPTTLTCEFCGQKYGRSSLKIHQKRCISRGDKPITLHLNDNPNTRQISEFNAKAYENFSRAVLKTCPNCNRSFYEDRLEIHLRSCHPRTPNNSKQRQKGQSNPLPRAAFSHTSTFPDVIIKTPLISHSNNPSTRPSTVHNLPPTINSRPSTMDSFRNYSQASTPPSPSQITGISGRRPVPQPTAEMECERCGLFYLPTALEAHMRYCNPHRKLALPDSKSPVSSESSFDSPNVISSAYNNNLSHSIVRQLMDEVSILRYEVRTMRDLLTEHIQQTPANSVNICRSCSMPFPSEVLARKPTRLFCNFCGTESQR